MRNRTITIKRRKKASKSKTKRYMENFEEWLGYWRDNPHRFITDYLWLRLYDFQKILIYMMFKYPSFVYVASRGLAKSTLALIFATSYCILYPGTTVVVVAPTRGQSTRFVKKVQDLSRGRINLIQEIKDVKTGLNESRIDFNNGSAIITLPYSENSLGARCQILIVDEFVRTEKEVISRVFVPMLSSPRAPDYVDLTSKERQALPEEPNRQLYLSSIRGADEWSYAYFLQYIDSMTNGDKQYITVALPYNLGVKNRYISRAIVEQSFKENQDSVEMLLAEYCCQPERGGGDSFYKYNVLAEKRTECRAFVPMNDFEYLEYKNDKSKWKYYVEKLPGEIRILSMDFAAVSSNKNDNTAIWILRLVRDGDGYKRIFSYAESMNGINTMQQVLRAKQLFYEFDCDYYVLDSCGSGIGCFDVATKETEDYNRGEIYPAWTVLNPEDLDKRQRTIDDNAVPVIYAAPSSGINNKSRMLIHSRDIFSTNKIAILVDTQDGLDYLNQTFQFYKEDNQDLRGRCLQSYAQTSAFINEAINLKQISVQGRTSVEEKSGRRKDRVMSMVYALDYAKKLEDELNTNNEANIFDYMFFT